MNNWKRFKRQHFSTVNLLDTYNTKIVFSRATGVDNKSHTTFKKELNSEVDLISRKVLSGEYKFSNYKLKLISKGRGKIPREISIPTIRDRITLRVLNDFLQETKFENIVSNHPQAIIKKIIEDLTIGNYDSFIRLDIENYFPSINHEKLMSFLRRKIRKKEILVLIEKAIKNPTVVFGQKSLTVHEKGIPQGISISNLLSNLYFSKIDGYYKTANISYSRYVDDILILCDSEDVSGIVESIKNESKKLGLSIHSPDKLGNKSRIGLLTESFSYLGYYFDRNKISVRKETINRLRDSIISHFINFRRVGNEKFLLWILNLKITGCIFENRTRGWLLYFSKINDESLLHSLDNFVLKLCERFGITLNPKKFVRTYYSINYNFYQNKYVPNFDEIELDDQKFILVDVFEFKKIHSLSDDQVRYHFRKKISYHVRELEKDIKDLS